MKQYLSIPTALLIAVLSHAQTDTQNYIRATVYQVATQNGTTSADTGQPLTADEKTETITYYDGLGRPKQHIAKQAGGDREDLITPVAYDPYGRQAKDYLPYARSSSSLNFESSLLPDGNGNLLPLHSFYQGKFPDDFTGVSTANANPYSEKLFEASPLNRVMKQGAPGKDWKVNPSGDNDHSIKFGYQTNAANEVKLFRVVFPTQDTEQPQLEYQGYYAPNELYKTVIKDENWKPGQIYGKAHTTEEFKDKQGKVILKRTYNNNNTAHDTYYVYDDYGNLTYVLSPEGSDTVLDGNNNVQQSVLDKLCYQYRYDRRNRLVEKKLPGKGWEHIVHDKLDRPILTQDALLRASNRWLFTKYDTFDRVVYTGTMNSSSTRAALQALVDGQPHKSETRTTTTTTIAGTAVYYDNGAYPYTGIHQLLTVNYYDTYNPELTAVAGNPGTVFGQSTTTSTKTLATGSKVRVLGTNNWITNVIYYDAKARPIYGASENGYLKAYDITKTQLDFVGKVLKTESSHAKSPNPAIVVTDVFAYDHAGRLLAQKRQMGSGAQQLIAKHTYDNLGQLAAKDVGNTEATPLQTIDYAYNVRGWLKQINDPSNLGSDLFSFQLGYNSPVVTGTTPLYNGNISETLWKTANTDNGLKSYRYTYDALNRIRTGIDNTNNYSLGSNSSIKPVTYDKNGNILSLYRMGHTNAAATTFGVMDNLAYTYDGNQLLKVSDSGNPTYGFKDGNTSGNDYTYDANGNLISDANKGITSIIWNHINLPTEIKFNNSNTQKINYTYSADGIKIRKVVNDGGAITTTDYAGAYQYVNNDLKFIKNIEDGYVYPKSGGGFGYAYYYTDQLDNIRLLYTDANGDGAVTSNEIIKEAHFYPFGLVHKGYNSVVNPIGSSFHKYDYQNQERQDELGLNWLQFKYRMHDPAIGRFVSIDPLAMEYPHNSTYAFAENKVIKFNELEGLEVYFNKFDRLSYENQNAQGKVGTFVVNSGISLVNGLIDVWNYAGDLTDPDAPLTGMSYGANKLADDTKATAGAIKDYAQNTTWGEFTDDVGDALSKVETYENIAGSIVGAKGFDKLSKLKFGTINRSTSTFTLGEGFNSFSSFKRTFGSAGEGKAWHHIVEQHADNVAQFGAESIHNTKNLIKLEHGKGSIHAKVTGYYNSKLPGTDMRVRDYVKTLPYEEQYQYGLDVLKRFGYEGELP